MQYVINLIFSNPQFFEKDNSVENAYYLLSVWILENNITKRKNPNTLKKSWYSDKKDTWFESDERLLEAYVEDKKKPS